MARRFVIDKEINLNEEFEILGEEAKHICVLRHKTGDRILVNDKICEIKDINKQKVICYSLEQEEKKGIPNTKVTLFQAILKSDKMDYVIQKSVEIGASKIEPFISKNVVVKLDDKDKAKKVDRWNKISVEALKQCGRSDIVNVERINSFEEVLNKLKQYDVVILAYENETKELKTIIKDNLCAKNIGIIIGAEGGFEKSEVDKFLSFENCFSVSLGERILRAETASLNLLSILMYEFDM